LILNKRNHSEMETVEIVRPMTTLTREENPTAQRGEKSRLCDA
jgi:hypothetical protein